MRIMRGQLLPERTNMRAVLDESAELPTDVHMPGWQHERRIVHVMRRRILS